MKRTSRTVVGTAAAAAVLLGTGACSGVDQDGAGETLTFASVAGWDDTVAVTALWTVLLEERGYSIEVVNADLAAGISGIARGDIDAYLNAWLPATHETVIEENRDDIVILDDEGAYFEDNRQALVVPDFVEEETISDLVENADAYDNRIVGLEAGSGNMELLPGVLETYGAEDDFEIVDGSTPAALAELENAVADEEPVVISLWTPHWVYADLDVRPLEDDQQGWPEPDGSFVVTSESFPEEHEEVAEWMTGATLTDEQYSSLMLEVDEADSEREGAEAWLEDSDHRDVVEAWFE